MSLRRPLAEPRGITPLTDPDEREKLTGDADMSASEPLDSTFELLKRARSGDRDALEQVFARHIPMLQRWASGRFPRWARDISDTPDLVQETVLQTFKSIEDFEPRGEGALQAYLRQALLNRIRTEFRRTGRRPSMEELESQEEAQGTSPLEAAIGQETVEHYETALSRLRPEEREAIISRVEFGLTYQEIADAFDKPSMDAARKTVVRALMRLAEQMKRLRE